MPDLVRDALQSAGLRPGDGSAVRVTVRCAPDLSVRVDRRLVLRLIVNLLTNAREALNGSRGDIGLAAELRPGGGDGRRRLAIEVRDSGRGMSDEFIRNGLFKPFATTKAGGLGVGLTQCRSIVEAHGGTIEVESQVGVGSRFTVVLPVDPAAGDGA
jgi:signal transduction histidine kinase